MHVAQSQIVNLYCPEEKGQKGRIIMSNNTNTQNNAAVNQNVKEESTMNTNTNTISNNARVAGATPFALLGAGLAAGAELCRQAAEFIGGDQVSRAPGYEYLAAHTAGSLSAKRKAAIKEAVMANTPLGKHSPYVEWDKWHWVPSQSYIEAQKKAGYEEAFLLSLYKAANGLINFAKYGKGNIRAEYKGVSYAARIYIHLANHAAYLRDKKGVKNAMEQLEAFYKEACWLSMVSQDKLPKWEDVKAVAEEALKNGAKKETAAAAANLKHSQEPEVAPQPVPEPIAVGLEKVSGEVRDLIVSEIAPGFDSGSVEVEEVKDGIVFVSACLCGEPASVRIDVNTLMYSSAYFEANECFKDDLSLEVVDVDELREGRAPAEAESSGADQEPEEVVRKYDELRKVVGVTAVRANNAKAAAEKAKAAFEAGKINASEMRHFIEKAASKFPEGSDEAAAILALC